MKTKFLTLLLLLSAAVVSAETMRVAILEPVDRENKVSYGTKLILRSNLAKAVTNTAGYEAYDRSDMDAIMGEQNFQRTGMVSEDQIKRLGEMTGAKFILVAEAAIIDAQNMFITAKVLDVETARTVMTDNLMMGIDAKRIQEGCATLAGNLFRTTATTSSAKTKSEIIPIKGNKSIQEDNTIKLVKNTKTDIKLYGKSAYSYGGTEMDKKAMEQFLYNNCPAAYSEYMSGKTLKKAGWGVFGAGLALTFFGTMIAAEAIKIPIGPYQEYEIGGIIIGVGLGSAATIGIPLLCTGYRRTNHAHEIFNRQCATKEKLTLNLQASQNGLGLALNF